MAKITAPILTVDMDKGFAHQTRTDFVVTSITGVRIDGRSTDSDKYFIPIVEFSGRQMNFETDAVFRSGKGDAAWTVGNEDWELLIEMDEETRVLIDGRIRFSVRPPKAPIDRTVNNR